MPDLKSIELIDTLREKRPETCLLVFSHWPHIKVSKLLRAGAVGVLLETDPLLLLPEAIHIIRQGETWISPKGQALDSSDGNGHSETLFTTKELQLFPLLAKGWNSQEIADELGIGERTVRDYEHSMKQKLGLESRAKLVAWIAGNSEETNLELEQPLSN